MPEVESVPLHCTATGVRYQPAPFGARLGVTEVDGGVASTLSTLVVTEVVPPSPVAVQVSVVPELGSSMRIAGSQPVVDVIGPLTDQCTTMNAPLALPTYQPLFPWTPSIVYPTVGGASAAPKRAAACVGTRKAAASPSATHHDVRCTSDPGGEETTRCSPGSSPARVLRCAARCNSHK